MQTSPKVAIIVLNYNGLRWLPRCLSSVLRTKYRNYQVYVIDNGSVDKSVKYVQENYREVKIIQNRTNLGFAEAYNRAINQIEAEYVFLLNNDTEILNPNWLSSLVRIADKDLTIAAVATRMVSMEDHRFLDSVGGMGIPYWRGFIDIGKQELDSGQYPSSFEPFAFCGGAALLRKTIFVDAGGFDREMFLFVEDSDLSWRLRLLGWNVRYAPNAEIAHHLGGTIIGGKEISPVKLYFCHRNLLRSVMKNCGSSLSWALRNYVLYSFLMISGFLIYEPRKAVLVIEAIAWNIRSFGSTYLSRLRVQGRRKVNEREILRHMYPHISRKQPEDHPTFRRILNVLFDYSNQRKLQTETQTRTSR